MFTVQLINDTKHKSKSTQERLQKKMTEFSGMAQSEYRSKFHPEPVAWLEEDRAQEIPSQFDRAGTFLYQGTLTQNDSIYMTNTHTLI